MIELLLPFMGFLAGTLGLIFVVKNFRALNGSAMLKKSAKKASEESEPKADVPDLTDWSDALQQSYVDLNVSSGLDTLADRSRRMSKMIGVIDDISFRTNLLALNAAVDTANAGEQPRGFSESAVDLARQAAEVSRELGVLLRDVRELPRVSGPHLHRVNTKSDEMVETTKRIVEIVASIQAAAESAQRGATQTNIVAARLITISAMFYALEHDAKAIEQSLQGDINAIAKTGVIPSPT